MREPTDFFRNGAGLVHVVRGAADGDIEADAQHQVLEDLAVLALFDGLGLGADHFHAMRSRTPLCRGVSSRC
jgi:hypothetical protein